MILRKKKRVKNLLGDGPAKREREDPESEEGPRKKRRSGDVAIVVEHCLYISPRQPVDVLELTITHIQTTLDRTSVSRRGKSDLSSGPTVSTIG